MSSVKWRLLGVALPRSAIFTDMRGVETGDCKDDTDVGGRVEVGGGDGDAGAGVAVAGVMVEDERGVCGMAPTLARLDR